jgi:transcriptional regulator with XRE-family HTH domain
MGKMIENAEAVTNVAANVRRLLRDRGWPQSRLAGLTGEPEMQISRIVRGLILPNVATLARIAEAFDVSIDRLVARPPAKVLDEAS